MSDSAFQSAPFPAYTTAHLREIADNMLVPETGAKMRAEIERREKRDAGDVSVMTPAERLRHIRKGN